MRPSAEEKKMVQEYLASKNGKRALEGVFNAAELLEEELPPARFAVEGVLPEGVNILAGKPKIGKSWLVAGLCVAVATGGVALGVRPVEQGSVLYLGLEDNKRRLQKRLKKLLAGDPAPKKLDIQIQWPRLDEDGLEQLEQWLESHPDARLVVIDTLKKIRPRSNANRSVYDVDYEALEPLIPLAAKHQVCIVVVHHVRKLAAIDPLDEISGSTGLSGGVDGALVLKRDRGKADAYLHVTGRDVEEDLELALEWDANTAGWCIVGDAEEYRLSEERREVTAVINRAGRPMSPKETADALGKDHNATKKLMWHMAQDGQLNNNNGKYSTTTNYGNSGNRSNSVHRGNSGNSNGAGLRGEQGYRVTKVTGGVGVAGKHCKHGVADGCAECVQEINRLIDEGMMPKLAIGEVFGE